MIRRVGSLVEAPALLPTFTARQNLELLGRLNGIGPRAVDAELDRVGLAERADDLVASFSLGMRQRLGLAAALLKDPAVLDLGRARGTGSTPRASRRSASCSDTSAVRAARCSCRVIN